LALRTVAFFQAELQCLAQLMAGGLSGSPIVQGPLATRFWGSDKNLRELCSNDGFTTLQIH
jgi:hypothetical protein